jgi:cysteine desulfurase
VPGPAPPARRRDHLPVDGHGLVDPADLAAAITPHTVLAPVINANNETGTIPPIAELARIAHEHGVVIHTDAAQAAGKIPLDVAALGVVLLNHCRAQDVRTQGHRRSFAATIRCRGLS